MTSRPKRDSHPEYSKSISDDDRLPPYVASTKRSLGQRILFCCISLILLSCIVVLNKMPIDTLNLFISNIWIRGYYNYNRIGGQANEPCPQMGPLFPVANAEISQILENLYDTNAFKKESIDRLSGAIQIPTETFDDMGPVGKNVEWEKFDAFHDYLRKIFPLVHSSGSLVLTKVDTYGLLYHWQGSNKELKPILLAAHQDTVPVEPTTVDQWTYPPFSGHFDGEWIWGRGTVDQKAGVIGILTAVEALLENQFQPTRTIVLAFGFDEEASGLQGAHELSIELLRVYGENGIALLLDEGSGYTTDNGFGAVVALPDFTEKGFIDVRLEISTPGGHSSAPPAHTSIGVLAALLVKIENNPIASRLSRKNAVYTTMTCMAAHSPDMPEDLRQTVKRSLKSDKALLSLEKLLYLDEDMKSLISTTQAIDLINGGVKSNALPEHASAVINHRIATDRAISDVQQHYIDVLRPLAAEFNLTFSAFGDVIVPGSASRNLNVTEAYGGSRPPAPLSPVETLSGAYGVLSGSIQATFRASIMKGTNETGVIAPGIQSGNTDTFYYWNLSPNIYRYYHLHMESLKGIHTVNEALRAEAFWEEIRFFTYLILNTDESTEI